MKTAPILPAQVDFSDAAPPQAPAFGDVYHPPAGAFTQARQVFLDGNGLPGRWAGRTRFVVLETGFGLGNNFLATWAAWRDDAQRCERLVFLSIEKHPLTQQDLQRAHAASPEPALAQRLVDAWPPLVPSLHTLDFEQGRVRLMLAFGDAKDWLPELVAQVDAFYLDGFAPAKNPDLWTVDLLRQLGRLAAPGATAATWSVARTTRDGLAAAGFVIERRPGMNGKWATLRARFEPRHQAPTPPGRRPVAPEARQVLIIGAGLAGAACARALALQGLHCTVLEAGRTAASQASGNAGGLFHATLHADDGPHARFNRVSALMTERLLRALSPQLPWLQWGLLRVERDPDALATMHALLARTGLPSALVQVLDAESASALAGHTLDRPAWYFPGGGAVSPPALTQAWLAQADATLCTDRRVARLHRTEAGRWQALDADDQPIVEADAVVLAAGTANAALAAPWVDGLAWPWVAQRGQLSRLDRSDAPSPLHMPVAGVGYALTLPDGDWCFGASADAHDLDPTLRATDHAQNLARLQQLLPDLRLGRSASDAATAPSNGRAPSLTAGCTAADTGRATQALPPVAGRVGWRSLMPDRLPVVGPLPAAAPAHRAEQPRFWERQPGLLICGGLASRGLTWAALCGELVAAQLTGAPWPIETSLADAMDPARFGAKARRQST